MPAEHTYHVHHTAAVAVSRCNLAVGVELNCYTKVSATQRLFFITLQCFCTTDHREAPPRQPRHTDHEMALPAAPSRHAAAHRTTPIQSSSDVRACLFQPRWVVGCGDRGNIAAAVQVVLHMAQHNTALNDRSRRLIGRASHVCPGHHSTCQPLQCRFANHGALATKSA